MESYCVKNKKQKKNINSRVLGTSNGKAIILSKCTTCSSKKSRFIKNWKAKGLLSNLGIQTPFSKVPVLVDILFWTQFHSVYKKWMK